MFSSPLISIRTVAAVSLPETTVAWPSRRTSWESPEPVTNVMASQETDGYLPASRRIAPSALARSYPGLLTRIDPPKRPFGAGKVRGLDAKESAATGSWVGYKDLARLRRG